MATHDQTAQEAKARLAANEKAEAASLAAKEKAEAAALAEAKAVAAAAKEKTEAAEQRRLFYEQMERAVARSERRPECSSLMSLLMKTLPRDPESETDDVNQRSEGDDNPQKHNSGTATSEDKMAAAIATSTSEDEVDAKEHKMPTANLAEDEKGMDDGLGVDAKMEDVVEEDGFGVATDAKMEEDGFGVATVDGTLGQKEEEVDADHDSSSSVYDRDESSDLDDPHDELPGSDATQPVGSSDVTQPPTTKKRRRRAPILSWNKSKRRRISHATSPAVNVLGQKNGPDSRMLYKVECQDGTTQWQSASVIPATILARYRRQPKTLAI